MNDAGYQDTQFGNAGQAPSAVDQRRTRRAIASVFSNVFGATGSVGQQPVSSASQTGNTSQGQSYYWASTPMAIGSILADAFGSWASARQERLRQAQSGQAPATGTTVSQQSQKLRFWQAFGESLGSRSGQAGGR